MMRNAGVMAAGFVALHTISAIAQAPPGIAVFDIQLLNTSPAPSTQMEIARTQRTTDALRDAIAASGHYRVIDIAPVRAALEEGQ